MQYYTLFIKIYYNFNIKNLNHNLQSATTLQNIFDLTNTKHFLTIFYFFRDLFVEMRFRNRLKTSKNKQESEELNADGDDESFETIYSGDSIITKTITQSKNIKKISKFVLKVT